MVLYNGGPLHTGVYVTEPVRELTGLKWKFETAGDVTGPPLVYDGVVYFGDWKDHFYAVDVETGEERWSRAGVEAAARMGFARVILARELTLDEMADCAAVPGIEVEVFVHGALCYSYSGQCLFSQVHQERSANKGACAQPCRRAATANAR